MRKIVASFAAALLLGGSTVALAQQGKEGQPQPNAGGEQRGTATPSGGGSERGRGADQGRGPAADRAQGETQRSQDKAPSRARETQDKQPDRPRQAQDKQPDRPKQAQDKQPDRAREAQDKQPDRPKQAQDKQSDRDRQAQDKQQQDRAKQRAQDKQPDAAKQVQDKQVPDQSRQADDKQQRPGSAATGASERDGRGESVQLSNEQRQKLRDEFRRSRTNVRHYTNVRVNVSLGQRLPRTWTYYSVPQYVVEVAPRYRGYRYAWVDNRYCIVDPATYEIVAYVDDSSGVIYASDGGGSATTGRGSGEGGSTVGRCEANFTDAERRRIIAEVEDRRPMSVPEVRIGIDIPGDIELKIFPTRLRDEFERLDGCRYVPISNDSIAIVEPSTRRIVAIVER